MQQRPGGSPRLVRSRPLLSGILLASAGGKGRRPTAIFPVRSRTRGRMAQSAKELLRQAVENLPPDATVEQAMERLLFLAKIQHGIDEADAGKTLSHEEVGKRLGL